MFRCLTLLSALLLFTPSAFTLEGRVTFINGKAEKASDGKSALLKLGDSIKEGDILTTAANSRLGFLFSDGASFLMTAGTTLEIKTGSVFYQTTGAVSTSFRAQKPGSAWAVKTPTVVCAVRGTAFTVEASKSSTRVVMFKGKVIVKDFVRESGLSTDPNEMMQDFLNDIEINSGTALTYNGIDVKKENVDLKKEKTTALREEHLVIEKSDAWKKAVKELKLANSAAE